MLTPNHAVLGGVGWREGKVVIQAFAVFYGLIV